MRYLDIPQMIIDCCHSWTGIDLPYFQADKKLPLAGPKVVGPKNTPPLAVRTRMPIPRPPTLHLKLIRLTFDITCYFQHQRIRCRPVPRNYPHVFDRDLRLGQRLTSDYLADRARYHRRASIIADQSRGGAVRIVSSHAVSTNNAWF